MAVKRSAKEQILAELEAQLENAKSIVFADYRGTTVKKIDELRSNLRKEGIVTKVAKITLIRRALKKHGVDISGMDFKAPVVLGVSKLDEVAPARIFAAFVKENKNVKILAGVMDNKFLSAEEVGALAALPSKQEMLGKLVGTINAPISSFVNVLAGNVRSIVNVLNAIKESKA
ncbi:MAG: ribosomal protein [Candidatus Doudnabacteria bacterium]|nr:ribosomal protein [Candidatus Doudnabacteria bacterium]